MTFEVWIQDLYRRRRQVNPEEAFAQFKEACALFDDPQKAFKAVHVGGTNGKGSVAFGAYDQLRRLGMHVGLFTSPHLTCPTERIEVDGVRISKDELRAVGSRVLQRCPNLNFFAWITLVAFIYFRESGIEWGVFEVGIGGRFDPTRVVLSEVAVIVSIGLDHADILGNSLEEIAANKGAILREGARHILGPSASRWIHSPNGVHIPEQSSYIEENNALVRAVVSALGFEIQEPIAKPPARFEALDGGIIVDVAHNPAAFVALAELLEGKDWEVLIALSKDKDIAGCLAPLQDKAACFHLVRFGGERAAHCPGDLMRRVTSAKTICYDCVQSAIEGWFSKLGRRLVCGSFHLVGPTVEFLHKQSLRSSLGIPQSV